MKKKIGPKKVGEYLYHWVTELCFWLIFKLFHLFLSVYFNLHTALHHSASLMIKVGNRTFPAFHVGL